MRKLWIFLFLVLLVSIFYFVPQKTELEVMGQVECYYPTGECFKPESSNVVSNGNGVIVQYNGLLDSFLKDEINCTGKTIILHKNSTSLDEIIKKLNLKILKSDSNDEMIYGYTTKFNRSVMIKSKKINTQIAVREDKIYIGTPLLLGSY